MKPMDFKGIIPPMITPFTKEGEIYEKGIRELTDFIVPYVQGLFICGTFGSGPLMSLEERSKVAEIIFDQVKGRVPIIVQVGTPATKSTIELARHAQNIGAAAVAAITPYFYSYDDDAIFMHFQQLMKSVDIPVFLYDNPKCTGNPISVNLLVRLAKEGLAGIKDSTFDIMNYYNIRIALKEFSEMNLMIGNGALFVAAFDAGAIVAVAGTGNMYPDLLQKMYQEYLQGDRSALMKTQEKVQVIRQVTKYGPTVLSTCYAMLKLRGVDAGYPRPPFKMISPEIEERVKNKLKSVALL